MIIDRDTRVVALIVAATKVGDQVQLIDRQGRALTGMIDRKLLGKLVREEDASKLLWQRMVRKHLGRIKPRFAPSSPRGQWVRKCNSLAASFLRRSGDMQRPKSRQRHEEYSTKTWKSAAHRLWHQGNNRKRHVTRSGWHRWSITVANNHNKRTGGRYARS